MSRARQYRRLLERALARGELSREADLGHLVEMLTGATLVRLLAPELARPDWPTPVVDALLAGAATAQAHGA